MTDQTNALALLREPFPASAIDTLPRGGAKISYVGHAQTTARLLDADPAWTWEPVSFDEHGQPMLARRPDGAPYGLWIKLTVCGVTRYGFGELPAQKQADGVKEAIGDAIRNAAMRFGVALDLWSKSELASASVGSGGEDVSEPASPAPTNPTEAAPQLALAPDEPPTEAPSARMADNNDKAAIHILIDKHNIPDPVYRALLKGKYDVESSTQLRHLQAQELESVLRNDAKRERALKWAAARVPKERTG